MSVAGHEKCTHCWSGVETCIGGSNEKKKARKDVEELETFNIRLHCIRWYGRTVFAKTHNEKRQKFTLQHYGMRCAETLFVINQERHAYTFLNDFLKNGL